MIEKVKFSTWQCYYCGEQKSGQPDPSAECSYHADSFAQDKDVDLILEENQSTVAQTQGSGASSLNSSGSSSMQRSIQYRLSASASKGTYHARRRALMDSCLRDGLSKCAIVN